MHNSKIKKRIQQYEENKKIVESGNYKFVPFYGFPRLERYIPGVIPGIMYKITSHMGVGKTQIAKYLFTYQTILYSIKHGINFKVLYFALEESEEQFLDGLFIHILRRVYKVQLDRFNLGGTSMTSLTQKELDAIKGAEVMVANFVRNMEIIDDKYKPTAIYNTCKYYAKKWGTFAKDAEGNDIETSYVPKDPKQIVLVITDHISLLEGEFDVETGKYLDDRRAIARWHTEYCRRIITKCWNWAVLNVQQQSLDSEKQQFTSKGSTIVNKILPSLDGLANNKEVGRDDFVTLGIFAPARYDLDKYLGYEIKNNTMTSFDDRFRSLHLLKNRFGHPNKVLPLYFDGRYTYFRELPDAKDPGMKYFYNLLTK